jgi:hypothetical protein
MSVSEWNPPEERRSLNEIDVGGFHVRSGDRVRLWPRGGADIIDVVLRGKTATVVAIEEDYEKRIHLAVTVDDDPGQDLGRQGRPAHRFFFGIEEVEPIVGEQSGPG